MDDPNAPSMWLLLILGMLLMGGFIFVLWGVNRLAGRHKSGEEETRRVTSRPITEAAPAPRPSLTSLIMSLLLGQAGPIEGVDTQECHQVTTPVDVIATPSPAVTSSLTGDAPGDEVRAQAIADLLRAGLLTNQAKAIEVVYHCPRASSSRPESPYQRAKAQIDALTETGPQFPAPLTEAQKVLRKELALE